MTFCGYMDPLNWSFRFYLLEAIEKVGFDEGWDAIIAHVNQLSLTLLKTEFKVNARQCHLFYLQMLAEFGDFRRFSDPLTLPSQEIKDRIRQMRRAELRHELIITNNQMRYNNHIIRHHGATPNKNEKFSTFWKRFPTEVKTESPGPSPNILAHIASAAKTYDWFKNLPDNGRGSVGLKDMTIDHIISRCVTGAVVEPIELMRDIFHLIVNLSLSGMSEKEKVSVNLMKMYFLDQLKPLLADDPRWEKVRPYVEGNAPDDY
ncbi:hypothetical protein TRFO_07677 [Tritrichomonas foetus]|uniref:Uncharacterized protein n=1 Tax=Tritrichomonas foetus TaxID=1144522 RepID=A0A1J4JPP8_9EUKA|nr:hypothetical protein TRFO_07677 [Tritrichomonas foetus]|eukprot:OHT01011.1 hypothetical protein TRFO_07677 [Tritrichomonas foetus]